MSTATDHEYANVPDIQDEDGVSLLEYRDAADRYGNEVFDRINERTLRGVTNYLFAYGVPENPRNLLGFAETLGTALLAGLTADGLIQPAEGATVTEAEMAERTEARERVAQDPMAALRQAVNGQNTEPTDYAPLGYL